MKTYSPRPYGSVVAVVAEAIDQVGGSGHAAHVLDVSIEMATSFARPDTGRNISYQAMRRLVQAGAVAPAEDLAKAAGGLFLPLPEAPGEISALSARTAREAGEALAIVIEALADGEVTPDEQRRMVKEVDDVIHVAGLLRAAILRAVPPGDQ